MTDVNEFNQYGEELENILKLDTSPVAVKMLINKDEIPKAAIQPKKDYNYHLAQCQAFAMSRREKAAVAMLIEDNRCPAPVVAYGLAPLPDDPTAKEHYTYESFEYGKYVGILSAPLYAATFEPDVTIVYCDTNQLRTILLSLKNEDRPLVGGHYFPPSCVYSVVTPMLTDQYGIILPDPGEYTRALTQAGEMMFAIPKSRLTGLVSDIRRYNKNEFGFAHAQMFMRPDFPQPEFYKRVFKSWGLNHK